MALLGKLKSTLTQLNERQFYLYLGGFVALVLLVMALLGYWHYTRVTYWQAQLVSLKKQRKETQSLLQQHEQLKADQVAVNQVLATDTNFKIIQYYSDLINQLHLRAYQAKEPGEPVTENLEGGAKEKTITTSFTNLTTKQVTDILAALEKNPRVYAKRLIIDKIAKDKPTLNVTMDIATIESPQE